MTTGVSVREGPRRMHLPLPVREEDRLKVGRTTSPSSRSGTYDSPTIHYEKEGRVRNHKGTRHCPSTLSTSP